MIQRTGRELRGGAERRSPLGLRWVTLLLGCLSMTLPAAADTVEGRAEIIDGDTIRVAADTVRLEGIDAPETRQECEDASGRSYQCGQHATRALGQLIGAAEVSCDVVGQDSYGRSLGVCTVGGQDVNAEMVRAGWALAFRRYSQRYVAEEREAQQSGVGLWSGRFDPPWEWRAGIVAESPPGDCIIKGNISRSGERIYHMPFQHHYDRTRINEGAGERWFCSEREAHRAGWRRALR